MVMLSTNFTKIHVDQKKKKGGFFGKKQIDSEEEEDEEEEEEEEDDKEMDKDKKKSKKKAGSEDEEASTETEEGDMCETSQPLSTSQLLFCVLLSSQPLTPTHMSVFSLYPSVPRSVCCCPYSPWHSSGFLLDASVPRSVCWTSSILPPNDCIFCVILPPHL